MKHDAGPLRGWLFAAFTVLIWGAWPSFTRLAVLGTLAPEDLVALRFGIAACLLCPVLILKAEARHARAIGFGALLALFQGAPVAILAARGLEMAPAAHLGALSPGLMPAFVAVLSWLIWRDNLHWARFGGVLAILIGAGVIVVGSFATPITQTWRGDLLFIFAGLSGAIYTLLVRRSGLDAWTSAAYIALWSALAHLPFYGLLTHPGTRLWTISTSDLVVQAVYQGVLMGAVSLFTLSRAVLLLGPIRTAVALASLPIITALIGIPLLGEVPSTLEWVALLLITLGVVAASGVGNKRRAED